MGLVRNTAPFDPAPVPEEPDPAALVAALSADQPGVRRAAARDLAQLPQAAAALCDRLEIETSPSVRAVIFNALIRLQNPEVAARLAVHLRSDDASLRNAAIEALQEMPDAVAPHLQTLLADPDSDIRLFAVNILGALRLPRAPAWLTEVLMREPHVNVCAAAVDALAEVGGLEAIAALEALRERFPQQPFMVFAIDTAIRRIRGA